MDQRHHIYVTNERRIPLLISDSFCLFSFHSIKIPSKFRHIKIFSSNIVSKFRSKTMAAYHKEHMTFKTFQTKRGTVPFIETLSLKSRHSLCRKCFHQISQIIQFFSHCTINCFPAIVYAETSLIQQTRNLQRFPKCLNLIKLQPRALLSLYFLFFFFFSKGRNKHVLLFSRQVQHNPGMENYVSLKGICFSSRASKNI